MREFFSRIGNSEIRNVLAVTTAAGCFVLLYLMLIKEIPVNNKDVLNVAIGFVFGSGLTGVYGYYFGSSKSGQPPAGDDGNK